MLDDLSVRTRMRGDDEVGALAEALDLLAENLSRTVQKLASERDRLAGILETMAEGVLLTDPDGKVALANTSLRSMVGSERTVDRQGAHRGHPQRRARRDHRRGRPSPRNR